jgi:small basic protein (TIGR04137 family)
MVSEQVFRDTEEAKRSIFMSMHRSLKAASKIVTKRNVLKRYERIELLRSRGKWKEGDRALGLPKTKPAE